MSTNLACTDSIALELEPSNNQETYFLPTPTPTASEKEKSEIEEWMEGVTRLMPPEFQLIIEKEDSKETTLRSSISSEAEAGSFIEALSSVTATNFMCYFKLSSPERFAFKKKWVCQHSKRGKVQNSKRNFDCASYVDLKIKNITRHTRKRDPFLKLSPPLLTVIKLNLKHSHPINTTSSLRLLRVNNKVKKKFFEYFANGMKPPEAKKFHESQIFSNNETSEILANAAINPTARQVSAMYGNWQQQEGYRNAEIENIIKIKQEPPDSEDEIMESLIVVENSETSTSSFINNVQLDSTGKEVMATNEEKLDFIVEIERLLNLCHSEIPRDDLIPLLKSIRKLETKTDFFMAIRTAAFAISEMSS